MRYSFINCCNNNVALLIFMQGAAFAIIGRIAGNRLSVQAEFNDLLPVAL